MLVSLSIKAYLDKVHFVLLSRICLFSQYELALTGNTEIFNATREIKFTIIHKLLKSFLLNYILIYVISLAEADKKDRNKLR